MPSIVQTLHLRGAKNPEKVDAVGLQPTASIPFLQYVFELQSGYFRLAVLQLLILQSISPNRLFLSDNRNLFHFLASLPSFQCKHHIWSPFKKADIAFPTDPAFTVEQTDKLLLHLPTAIWADPFAAHLCPSGWIMEASEQEIPYFRSNSRARVSPSWVI